MDPGFAIRGGANIKFARFSQKRHEMKKFWSIGGALPFPLGSASTPLPKILAPTLISLEKGHPHSN